jgi:threonine dehydrogenase-like Zn-dependent dehydrogenase
MCQNGLYTERGIKSLDGFGAEHFLLDPRFAVKVPRNMRRTGVLVEPASVVAKAWDQIQRIASRSVWTPSIVLITGAGPVGLLAALFGSRLGLEVHVFDQVSKGIKPELVHDLGATYHSGALGEVPQPSIVIDTTGSPALVAHATEAVDANGIVCLAGLSSGGPAVKVASELFGSDMVLNNKVLFGTVNANRDHYEDAANILEQADQSWLQRLITRRVPLSQWQSAFERRPDDVKTVLSFSEGASDSAGSD